MNTYNEEYQQTVKEVLANLQKQQQKLQSDKQTADYTLYYAQGAEITALDKFNRVVKEFKDAERLDTLGVQNDNLASNLQASATECAANVATSMTNAATAASNVQIAANAVELVAADIGSAFNIVSAADFDTQIYKLTEETNSLIGSTAYCADYASQLSMDATAASSEVNASQVQNDATIAKADVEKLLAATEAEFSKLATARANDVKKVGAAAQAEAVANGVLLDTASEYMSITAAYSNANKELNFGLAVNATTSTADKIFVDFSPFKAPFDDSTIPDPDPEYRLVIVPADKQALFNIDRAEMQFARQVVPKDTAPAKHEKSSFLSLETVDGMRAVTGKDMVDSEFCRIEMGKTYVAFLYIVLSLSFKKFTNNYCDLLSAPSRPFTLTTRLEAPKSIKPPSTGPAQSIIITSDAPTAAKSSLEYRCMFLPTGTSLKGQQPVTDSNDAGSTRPRVPFNFNLAIAEQVTAANYSVAKSSNDAGQYAAPIDDSTTDNFGNVIEENAKYIVAVLSIVTDENTSAQYQSRLWYAPSTYIIRPSQKT